VIYKITVQKTIKLKTVSVLTINNFIGKKWGFIEQYWTRNYRKFL